MMNQSRLDEFSRRYAAALFAVFPDWRQYAVQEESDGTECVMRVQVPPPSCTMDKLPLWILTDDEEITVGFDYYHVHFNRYADVQEAESFEDANSFIRDLVDEQIVVLSWWSGEEWRGSTSAKPGSIPAVPEWVKSADKLRIRSWRGTHDSDASA